MSDTTDTLIGAGIGLYFIDALGRRRRRPDYRRARTPKATRSETGTYKAFAQLTKTQKADVRKQMKPPYTGRTYRVVRGKVISRK